MLANGHKRTKQASVFACRIRSERILRARASKTKFLAQVTEPQVLVNASLASGASATARRDLLLWQPSGYGNGTRSFSVSTNFGGLEVGAVGLIFITLYLPRGSKGSGRFTFLTRPTRLKSFKNYEEFSESTIPYPEA
jgi:hypothetical protein